MEMIVAVLSAIWRIVSIRARRATSQEFQVRYQKRQKITFQKVGIICEILKWREIQITFNELVSSNLNAKQ